MASDMMTEDRALLAKALEVLQRADDIICDISEPEDWQREDPRLKYFDVQIGKEEHLARKGVIAEIHALLSSTAAQEALREREELLADRRRLDRLQEEMIAAPVLLHNLDTLDGIGRPRGLGLCGGQRTLRQAIDAMGEGGR